jgi:hypothetical protein
VVKTEGALAGDQNLKVKVAGFGVLLKQCQAFG